MPLGVNDVIHVTFKGTLFSQTILTGFSYKVSATSSTGSISQDQLDIATAFGNAGFDLNLKMRALQTADYSFQEVHVQRILPVRMAKSIYDTGGLAGQHAGTCETPNIAATLTRKTAFAGRKQLSTLHIAGLPSSEVTAGALENAFQLLLLSFGQETVDNQIITPSGGGAITLAPVIVHRPLGATNYDDIVDVDINELCRTMRRRTVGLGE